MRVWFTDANIIAHWTLGSGGLLEYLVKRFKLTEEFLEVYKRKYKDSLSFINEIIRQKENGLKDEFFISYLAGNELFSAVRQVVPHIVSVMILRNCTISFPCKS